LVIVGVLCLAACSLPQPRIPSIGAADPAANPSPGSPDAEATAAVAAQEPLRLVTLGDGYTAGTDTLAPKRDSWPAQLVQAMEHGTVPLRLVGNLAESGQTSQDVIRTQLPQVESLVPDVVTLQVGVNDIIDNEWRLDGDRYERSLGTILDGLLGILSPRRIFVITTPDHTLTAWGRRWGSPEAGSGDVTRANAILRTVAQQRGVAVIDIGAVYERVSEDASLVIGDGPSPSAKQYAGWVEVIGPGMLRVLTAEAR
jgi:lysophospholipase L1-like esterase